MIGRRLPLGEWPKSPPHTFRECPDGSLEIRASIGAKEWHGYLDEGHNWRGA